MNRYLFAFFVFALTFVMFSCKKDSTAPTAAPKTVDSIRLTVQRVTTPVAPKNPGNYSVWFSMVGNRIYYANPSNTANPQFMLEYNIGSNSFASKAVSLEVCACGYSSKLISDGTNIYYIANTAVKYTASSNTWSTLSYPATAQDNNGEAGVVYSNGKIYFLGGRTASTKFKYYDISSNSWYNLADGLFSTTSAQMVAINDKIYALGGESTRSKFSYYTSSAGWVALPSLPFQVTAYYDSHNTVSFGNRYIIAIAGKDMYIYDSSTGKWAINPIHSGINDSYLNLFSDNVNLYIAAKTSSNDFALYKIDVTNLP